MRFLSMAHIIINSMPYGKYQQEIIEPVLLLNVALLNQARPRLISML